MNLPKNALKRFIQLLLLIPVLCVLQFNWSLYYVPFCENGVNKDVLKQLKHLENSIKNDKIDFENQHLFPEGYFFTNVLYGLAWADLLKGIDRQNPIFQKGVSEIKWSISKLNSNDGRGIFSSKTPLPFGAFYNGWLTYLVGNYLQVAGVQNADSELLHFFENQCAIIQLAMSKTDLPYLETYIGQVWPADNILCVASLSLHDLLTTPQYKSTIFAWMQRIKLHLDAKTGMIPHVYSVRKNEGVGEVRGSSQSLMLCFLPAIDSVFAREQFDLYKKMFIQNKLGLSAVREFPLNTEGSGDVDSGPIIWDVGPVASVVGVKAMAENHDFELYTSIRNTIEAFGFSSENADFKHYLFNKLPIADAFIAWTNARNCDFSESQQRIFQWKFHLVCLLVLVPFCWWVYKL